MGEEYNYNQRLDIMFKHQEVIDVSKIVAECQDKWFNQTLTKIKGKDCLIQGHGQASGVYLQLGMASKLKGIYNWSLPQEVENFIEEVRLRL